MLETIPVKCPFHHGNELYEKEFCDGDPDNGLLMAVTYPCGCRLSIRNEAADALKELSNGPATLVDLADCLDLDFEDARRTMLWLEDRGLATMVGGEIEVVAATDRGMAAGLRWYFLDERQEPLLNGLKELLDTQVEIDEFIERLLIPFMALRTYQLILPLRDVLDSSTLKVPVNVKEQKAAMKAELEERLRTLSALFGCSDRSDRGEKMRKEYGLVGALLARPDRTGALEPICDMLQEYPATYPIMEAMLTYQDVKRRTSGFLL